MGKTPKWAAYLVIAIQIQLDMMKDLNSGPARGLLRGEGRTGDNINKNRRDCGGIN